MTRLPQPAPEPPAIAAPEELDYPGVIALFVDATDLQRGIFRVRERIPVRAPGPMTLLYPKWLPGYHAPQAHIELFAGLQVTGGGRALNWKRDPVEVYAFHLDVPTGVETIEAEFQFVSPTGPQHGRITVTTEMLNLQWNTVVLYPAGHYSRRIQVEAQLKLPDGWQFACALERASAEGDTTTFKPVSLDVLVDSPVFAGHHFRRIDLDDAGLVRFNVVADRPELLAATPEQIELHRALVVQTDLLFRTRPFDHFDFLIALSDELGNIGVEHHSSCETGTVPTYFTKWDDNTPTRDVIAHEYVHAWNGKYRRGADSWTPTFDRPIRNSLMWVYEGQTQYWGQVLSARAGLWTLQEALESLAITGAIYDNRAGGRWRPMSDTTRDPIIASRSPLPWVSWQRSEDYYSEGQLLWLDVDTLLRELSGDTRSLDTFAGTFFGGGHGSYVTSPYDFDEVIHTLDEVAPHDWTSFIVDKLESRREGAPLGGLTRGGYQLVYRDTPSEFGQKMGAAFGSTDLRFSIGVSVGNDGALREVLWESPAFEAGLTTGCRLLAVNGRDYNAEELKQAIVAAQQGAPVELLIKSGKRHRLTTIDYRGGLRFPHLEPIDGARRRLDEIFAPR